MNTHRPRTACVSTAAGLAGVGLLLLLLTGCITGVGGSRATAGKGHPSRRDIEEYFIGPGILQYFLLPQRLQGPNKQYADLDLVVRDSVGAPLWGILHVSVVGPGRLTPADTVWLATSGAPLALGSGRVLFAEPADKQELTRLEWYLKPAQVRAYLLAPAPALLVRPTTRPARVCYTPTKKALKRLEAFRGLTLESAP